jgi:hypothetical protein
MIPRLTDLVNNFFLLLKNLFSAENSESSDRKNPLYSCFDSYGFLSAITESIASQILRRLQAEGHVQAPVSAETSARPS